MYTFTTFSRSVLSSFACFCLSAAYAQQVPADEIEEIVVLADYRGRPASEIPASITILDEPTIGLHQRDNQRLVEALKAI